VALGEVFAVKDVFLEITIDQDDNGLQDDSPITPRQQIVTTAYAFRAKVAERVDDLAITEDMMAASSITTAKLGSGAVTTDKIIGSAVISTSIADGSVEMVDLADNSVSTSKLQADAVNGSKVADGSLTGADIQDSSLTTNDIAANTLTSDDYEDGSVTRHTLGSGAVQTAYTDELVMLRGTFNASGATILASTGLTCTWIGTGTYRLDYPGIFNGNPTVVASSHGTYSHDNMLSSYAQGPNACIVRVTDGGSNGGSLQNGEFNVILVGPGN
jgi:hypothetical protein